MNPCPCGQLGDVSGLCGCTAEQVSRYRGRVSFPLLDRIYLQMKMGRPRSFLSEHDGPQSESSESVTERVMAARAIRQQRSGGTNAQRDNAGAGPTARSAHPTAN